MIYIDIIGAVTTSMQFNNRKFIANQHSETILQCIKNSLFANQNINAPNERGEYLLNNIINHERTSDNYLIQFLLSIGAKLDKSRWEDSNLEVEIILVNYNVLLFIDSGIITIEELLCRRWHNMSMFAYISLINPIIFEILMENGADPWSVIKGKTIFQELEASNTDYNIITRYVYYGLIVPIEKIMNLHPTEQILIMYNFVL
jgi:hypothetical protein